MWSLTSADNAAWPSGSAARMRRGALGQPVHHPVQEGHEERVLAREVAVDPGADDARLRPDVGEPDGVEPPARRELGRRGEDPLTPRGIAATAGLGRDHLVMMAARRYRRHK